MVRVGEVYEHQGIKIKIVEVAPYYTYKRRKNLLIGYKLIDGDFTSPTAHFWMRETEDIRKKIEEVVKFYLEVKSSMHVI